MIEILLCTIFCIMLPLYFIFQWKSKRTERKTIEKIKRDKPDNMYFGQDKH